MNIGKINLFKSRRRHAMFGVLTALALTAAAGTLTTRGDEPSAAVSDTATAITRPSKESKLTFATPGIVAEIPVNSGDVIKQDQVLAKQDSREDEFTYQSMKLEADSMDKVTYSTADRDSKKFTKDRKHELYKEHVVSFSEVQEADLAVDLAEAQINLSVLEHKQAIAKAEAQRVKLELMQLRAPYAGVVEKVIANPGEMADPQNRDGAIIIGQWDPLWVEAHLSSAQAAHLKKDQTLQVKYENEDWRPAKILFLEKIDAASDTQLVMLELPNPGNAKYPGLHMQVKLPEKTIARGE